MRKIFFSPFLHVSVSLVETRYILADFKYQCLVLVLDWAFYTYNSNCDDETKANIEIGYPAE